MAGFVNGLKHTDVLKILAMVGDRLQPILADDAANVIEKAKASLMQSAKQHVESVRQERKGRRVQPWGFSINPDQPLRFKETGSDGHRVRVDLFSRAYWDTEPADAPTELTVAMRIWYLDKRVYFRDRWDAPRIKDEINVHRGRVMLRVHFDLAEPGQPGPRHHVQVGGKQHAGELHWFPDTLSVPRMLHMPYDLVLASELVAATFFPDEYRRIRREPTWKYCMRTAQQHLLPGYLQKAANAVSNGESVLDALWNCSWD